MLRFLEAIHCDADPNGGCVCSTFSVLVHAPHGLPLQWPLLSAALTPLRVPCSQMLPQSVCTLNPEPPTSSPCSLSFLLDQGARMETNSTNPCLFCYKERRPRFKFFITWTRDQLSGSAPRPGICRDRSPHRSPLKLKTKINETREPRRCSH